MSSLLSFTLLTLPFGARQPARLECGSHDQEGRAARRAEEVLREGGDPCLPHVPLHGREQLRGPAPSDKKMGVDLQSITLRLRAEWEGGKVVTERDEVLWCLVDRKVPDIAALYVTKSEARDTSRHSTEWRESLSTLWIAAYNGYAPVVRALIDRGADIDKARNNGATPLYIASQNGHVDVVRMLLEQGADIHKARDDGVTPLYIASQKGHVEVVRMLLEQGADIHKAHRMMGPPLCS